jgi:uncharacterized protein (DUF2141 family)
MKIIYSIGFAFLIASATTIIIAQEKQQNAGTGTLKVLVDGFKNDNGNAMIALCDSAECYKNSDKPFKGTMASIKDGKAEWIISDLHYGTYTISIYHDENVNGKLDTNALGVPKERYGFSNNARRIFSAPKFEEATFEFNKSEMTINITVK